MWSQGGTPNVATDLDPPLNSSLFDNAFGGQPCHIFLVKLTYRFLK